MGPDLYAVRFKVEEKVRVACSASATRAMESQGFEFETRVFYDDKKRDPVKRRIRLHVEPD